MRREAEVFFAANVWGRGPTGILHETCIDMRNKLWQLKKVGQKLMQVF